MIETIKILMTKMFTFISSLVQPVPNKAPAPAAVPVPARAPAPVQRWRWFLRCVWCQKELSNPSSWRRHRRFWCKVYRSTFFAHNLRSKDKKWSKYLEPIWSFTHLLPYTDIVYVWSNCKWRQWEQWNMFGARMKTIITVSCTFTYI